MEKNGDTHNAPKEDTISPLKEKSPIKDHFQERFSSLRRSLNLKIHETPKNKDKDGNEAAAISPTKELHEGKEGVRSPQGVPESGTEKSPIKDNFQERFSSLRRSLNLKIHETPKNKDKDGNEAAAISPTKELHEGKEGVHSPQGVPESGTGAQPVKNKPSFSFRRKPNRLSEVKEKCDEEDHLPDSEQPILNIIKEEKNFGKGDMENNEAIKEPVALLSVMEIHELIAENMLSEAFQQLKLLENELPPPGSTEEIDSTEIKRKWKDIQLLYHNFDEKIQSIVNESLNISEVDTVLFHSMMNIIEEEEKLHSVNEEIEDISSHEFLVRPKNWKHLWEKAIQENIRQRIQKYTVLQEKRTESELAVNLGYLIKQVVADISTVKNKLQKCYPVKCRILDIYVKHFHEAISSDVRHLSEKQMEYNELYAVLNWAINTYPSKDMMKHDDLQPDVNTENLGQLLDQETFNKLKNDYCRAVQQKIKEWMNNLINLEKDKWSKDKENSPEILNGHYHSPLHIDLQMMIAQHIKNAETIDKDLRNKLHMTCMEEVKCFVSRFQNTVEEWAMHSIADENISRVWSHLMAIINSFQDLKDGIKDLDDTHVNNHEEVERTICNALESFTKLILKQFMARTQMHFEKLMTRVWISDSEGFGEIMNMLCELSTHISKMKQPPQQNLIQVIHLHIVKEYIVQIMKRKTSYKKSSTCEMAVKRMVEQAESISGVFNGLGSTAEWLNNAIVYISAIIGTSDNKLILEKITALNEEYPDVSDEHISAILHYRRALTERKKKRILEDFKKLPKKDVPHTQKLFFEIATPSTVSCLSYVL